MKLMNLVSSFALGSIMGFTGPIHAILRALRRQLRQSRLRFSKKSRQLWSGSCWTGAVDRPPRRLQMRCLATIHEMDGETSTIQYFTSYFNQSHGQTPYYVSNSPYHLHVHLIRCSLWLYQFCIQMRRIRYLRVLRSTVISDYSTNSVDLQPKAV
jgi:hypothetical protein